MNSNLINIVVGMIIGFDIGFTIGVLGYNHILISVFRKLDRNMKVTIREIISFLSGDIEI